jgi:hypothetical protein
MSRIRKVVITAVAAMTGIAGLELGESFSNLGLPYVVTPAEAVVGRPLTPVSVAGTARRTTRRVVRRTAYRVSTLPAGCVYGPYYGAYYYNCAGAYYVQEGTVYIKVVFD